MTNPVKSILIIDDNPDDYEIVVEELKAGPLCTAEIYTCERLQTGIEMLRIHSVDILMLDLSLPDSSRLDGLKKIRELFPSLPVVIMTGLNDREMALLAIQEGAQDYLVKGDFDENLLAKTILYAAERNRLILENIENRELLEKQAADLREMNDQLKRSELGALNMMEDARRAEKRLAKSEKSLKEQAQELKRSNVDLERFAYAASHDLQEPLRVISTFSEILCERSAENQDDDTKKYFDYILQAVSRMQKLIDGLLEYSRLNSKNQPMDWVDTNRVLLQVMTDLDLAIKESDTKVSYTVLPEFNGYGSQIYSLFQNLLKNAIKFRHPDRSPVIYISVENIDNGYLLKFKDNGIGIDAKYQKQVFKIFERLHGYDEYEGTGMGLAICQRIVENHGGTIWVEDKNQPEEGTTFCLMLKKAL